LSENDQIGTKEEVGNLNPGSRSLNLTVKVISKNPIREVVSRRDGTSHRVTEALVADETGAILLTLWDDTIESITDGDVVVVNNGYIRLFRGSMRLNIGRFGSLEASEEDIENVNTENNMSEKQYEQERRYSGSRGYQSRGYGGRRNY
jgi:replication factor A1